MWPNPHCGFGHIYWRNPWWKTSFFVDCYIWKVMVLLTVVNTTVQLHSRKLNSGSVQVQFLFIVCRRCAMVKISDNMVPAGNKANCLSSVNDTTKTIHHHCDHHRHHEFGLCNQKIVKWCWLCNRFSWMSIWKSTNNKREY